MKSLKFKYYEVLLIAEIYLYLKLLNSRKAKWFNIVTFCHGASMVCFGNSINELFKGEFSKSLMFFVMFVAQLLLTQYLDSYKLSNNTSS
jgi:hypothetical protein